MLRAAEGGWNMEHSKVLMIRLKNEYETLMSVPENDMIHIEPAPGETPPHVKRYHVTYHVPTWVRDDDGEIRLQDTTGMLFEKMTLTDPVRIRVVEGRPPYHVNWYESGVYGGGVRFWNPGTSLYEYIAEVFSVLQFREEAINIHSPSNHAARDFYLQHRNDEPPMFPTDTRELPARPERGLKIRLVEGPRRTDRENRFE